MTPTAYQLSVPGVIPQEYYDQVRAVPALGGALDGKMLPALAGPGEPGERIDAFLAARQDGLASYQAAEVSGPPKVPTAEELMAGPIGPPPGDPMLRTFDRVCTDVLRTWFRGYADHLAAGSATLEVRDGELDALAGAAEAAFPWAPVEGRSAAVEVRLAKAAMHEAGG